MIWGERIRLKRLELDDIKKMMNWGQNDEALFSDYNFPQLSESEQKMWYGRKNQHGRKCFCIFNKENRLIGYIALRKLNYIDKSGEIGIVIDPNYHNMGYGTESIKIFLKWFFENFKFHKLNLIVAAYNSKAIRCYEKVGFSFKKEYYGKFYNDSFNPFEDENFKFREFFKDTSAGIQTKYIKMNIKKENYCKEKET